MARQTPQLWNPKHPFADLGVSLPEPKESRLVTALHAAASSRQGPRKIALRMETFAQLGHARASNCDLRCSRSSASRCRSQAI